MPDGGFTPEEINTSIAHPARIYDYYLGGKDNYEVDRAAADRILQLFPYARAWSLSNRGFLERAVRAVTRQGVRQIIDIGTGIPTSPNTHEVARTVDNDVRVVYVDNDPIVATYADVKLTNEGNAGFALADLREPEAVFESPAVRNLIDLDEPVALMMVAILHFISDEEDVAGIVSTLTRRLPKGSCLALSHVSSDFEANSSGDLLGAAKVYDTATARLNLRGREEILSFFDGFELLEPGLVQAPLWRPEEPVPSEEELRQYVGYVGVGVKSG
ncbi:SAM-dependent methyltransferase [Streptomyces boncukensis]|uniref:SAM-dependent methyltransferase n=1 Tax=Streptomyces boncukensis TaxID=2711219 RepID=A0A6G4WNM9_9ACTN|nr:SAM-dependent methyltransferase [Streptomyces boncukensis]NGO66869.1 SAM-dependent methyltransferase [Streptomyces boncukensis]